MTIKVQYSHEQEGQQAINGSHRIRPREHGRTGKQRSGFGEPAQSHRGRSFVSRLGSGRGRWRRGPVESIGSRPGLSELPRTSRSPRLRSWWSTSWTNWRAALGGFCRTCQVGREAGVGNLYIGSRNRHDHAHRRPYGEHQCLCGRVGTPIISQRTRDVLAVRRAQGVRLGKPERELALEMAERSETEKQQRSKPCKPLRNRLKTADG